MMSTLLIAIALAQTAQASTDDVLDVFENWTRISLEDLTIDGVRPYRATIAALDRRVFWASAQLGALTTEGDHRSRPGRVEVVVGDLTLDSSRFDPRDRRTASVTLSPNFVVEDVAIAIERDLWLVTDASFKAAVKQWQVKTASLALLGGGVPYPPDWTAQEPTVNVAPSTDFSLVTGPLRQLAIDGSARLRDIGGLRNGNVDVRSEVGNYLLVTAEHGADGPVSRLAQPEGYTVVYAWADHVRDDGVQIYDYRQWVARTADDLPPSEEILTAIEELGRSVMARAEAAPVDFYEGPVVFEGAAAADVFRYLVPGEVAGTPPTPRPDKNYEQLVRSGPRIGRRLLDAGWSIVDDPSGFPPHAAGGFQRDRQGALADRVELVDDGYVRDLLMTRVPRVERQQTNGHARGTIQGSWSARLSSWTVEPHKNLPEAAFWKRVDKHVRAANQDRILVVRSFERGSVGSLPRPADAVWRYTDGTEEPVLTLDFQHDDRRSLRDIVAAGGGRFQRPYLAPSTLHGTASSTVGLPSLVTAPRFLLIEELEAVFPGASQKPAAFGPPPLNATTAQ